MRISFTIIFISECKANRMKFKQLINPRRYTKSRRVCTAVLTFCTVAEFTLTHVTHNLSVYTVSKVKQQNLLNAF